MAHVLEKLSFQMSTLYLKTLRLAGTFREEISGACQAIVLRHDGRLFSASQAKVYLFALVHNTPVMAQRARQWVMTNLCSASEEFMMPPKREQPGWFAGRTPHSASAQSSAAVVQGSGGGLLGGDELTSDPDQGRAAGEEECWYILEGVYHEC